jgi:eukaryotic-like serine/threonine-protein kinase
VVDPDDLESSDRDPLLGQEIGGRYGILSRLGMGGMGAVYKAIDLSRDLTVAIKVLRESYAQHPAIRERFIREAEAGASLDHPNVVPLIDFGVEKGGRLWLAMEYVKGWTLRDEINHNGAFTTEASIELTKQVLRGLAVAHEAGLIHRDLKHDNIMYFGKRNDFTARIVDFGVVKSEAADLERGSSSALRSDQGELDLDRALQEASEAMEKGEGLGGQVLTAVGMMVGSPSYMAPEQIRGLKIGPPADLYALAVVVYEVLVARRLFTVNDYETLLKEGAQRDAPLLVFNARGELIPEGFAQIIARALAHDPNERYPDAQTMLLAVEQMKLRESTLPVDLLCRIPESILRVAKSSLGAKDRFASELRTKDLVNPTSQSQAKDLDPPLSPQSSMIAHSSEESLDADSIGGALDRKFWLLPPILLVVSFLSGYLLSL